MGRAVAAAVALGLALSACGTGSPEPTSLQTSSESATATPSPTPTPTPTASASTTKPGRVEITKGPGPTGPDVEAVKAFVAGYFSGINKAIETGKVGGVRSMYTSGCLDCVQLVSSIRSTYGSGGKFVGGLYTQNQIDVVALSGKTYIVHVTSLATAWKQYNRAGSVVNQGPAERVTYSYGVQKINNRWQLTAGGKR